MSTRHKHRHPLVTIAEGPGAQRKQRPSERELMTINYLVQWHALPPGPCGQCHKDSREARSVFSMLLLDTSEEAARDEVRADRSWVQMAERQALGRFDVSAMVCLCPGCAFDMVAHRVGSIAGDTGGSTGAGLLVAGTRIMFPWPVCDAYIAHGKPGPRHGLRYSWLLDYRNAELEAHCLAVARKVQYRRTGVRFQVEGFPTGREHLQ